MAFSPKIFPVERPHAAGAKAKRRGAIAAGLVKPTDVDRMDKTALRAALGAWGIPTSGKVELLRQRLAAKIANPNK